MVCAAHLSPAIVAASGSLALVGAEQSKKAKKQPLV